MSVPVGKSRGLLSDQNIAAWYSNLCEGSEITADVYLRRLGRFCEENDQTPQSLAGMDAKTAFNVLVTAVRRYREQGFAGSMIKGYVAKYVTRYSSLFNPNCAMSGGHQ